ncbi:MAG: tRNA (adenosine(37)-N6)-dimethylallyltransferase MiaA [Lachnospiraceae bacterium]|nr:tRNA (adenosine(37)-N6)-dimethylallyltransferase MiaA [Lachnospiraceae bacterium]
MKPRLLMINGPTAVGKSKAAVSLAKLIGGEIISADSMQVYKGMDIGTAKITSEEMDGVPHHLIDIIEPDEEFGVLRFKALADKAIEEITERGNIPIICGGTGFYIQAVLYDVDFTEYDDKKAEEIRKRLENELETNGSLYLFEKLKKIDPVYAGIIHPNNTKRLLHSLEFYELTGKRMSEHNLEQSQNESPFSFRYFVLTDDREKIYDRINKRVDMMVEAGLLEEVKGLLDKGYDEGLPSMLGIGYKEFVDHLKGRVTFEEAVENIKRETRHYAKKQMTWFKREKNVEFVNVGEFENFDMLVSHIFDLIRNFI